MDYKTITRRERSLKNGIRRAVRGLRPAKSGRLTGPDRTKIKKVVVRQLQRMLAAEQRRSDTKTYDWYFFMDGGTIWDLSYQENILGRNRYFVVDHEGPTVPINDSVSSIGSQRTRELAVDSAEISRIISKSARLFARLLEVTVSEEEDGKIWNAYRTVDERKIITITVGLPIALIAAAEVAPLAYTFGQTIGPALGKTFALNSVRTGLVNGATELGEQLFTGMILDDNFGLDKIDYSDVASSTLLNKNGAMLLNSVLDISYSKQEVNSFGNSMNGLLNRKTKSFIGNKFTTSLSETVGKFSRPISNVLDKTVHTVIRVGISKTNPEKKNERFQ